MSTVAPPSRLDRLFAWLATLFSSPRTREYRSAVLRLSQPGALTLAPERALLRDLELFVHADDLPRAIAVAWSLAQRHAQAGFYAKAAALLRRMLELSPADLDAHLSLARVYERLGRAREAARQYEVLGQLLTPLDPREAHAAFRRAIELDPSIETAWSGKIALEIRHPELSPAGSVELDPALFAPDPGPTTRYAPEELDRLLARDPGLDFPRDPDEPARGGRLTPALETPSGTIFLD